MLVNGLVSARWRREVERAKGRKVVVMKVTRPKIFASSESACSVCRDLFHGCFRSWRFCGGQDWRMLPSNHEGGRSTSKAKWKWMKMDEVFFFFWKSLPFGNLWATSWQAKRGTLQGLLRQDIASLRAVEGVRGSFVCHFCSKQITPKNTCIL